jgi:FAD/FMN-containing dehydrogenase/Fe-S oxidoreductase
MRLLPIRTATAHPARPAERWSGDAAALEARLRRTVQGEVRFDDGSRGLYSTDASNYRQVPIGVVAPRTVDDVVATVDACRRAGAPVLSRGGGTSLAGQCCNVAVVIDMSKYLTDIVDVDPQRRLATVQPGVVLDDLGQHTKRHGLLFAPDPSTHNSCTIGGMIGNNACGVHSVMAGKTDDNVEELDVLLYDGTRLTVGRTGEGELERVIAAGGRRGQLYAGLRDLRDSYEQHIRKGFPRIPRRVSGYNLDRLLAEQGFHVARALVGTESTCVTVLGATVNLVDAPAARALAVLGFPDVFAAADAVPALLEHGPIGLEGLDDSLARNLKRKGQHEEGRALLPEGGGWLLAEFAGGTPEEAAAVARQACDALGDGVRVRLLARPDEQQRLWELRKSGLAASAQAPGRQDAWPGWEDSAVPPHRLGAYLRDLRALFDDYGYTGAFYGHFGDGCLHVRSTFDLLTADGIDRFQSFLRDAADLVTSYGGSLSGEHGDGQARGQLLERMYGPELMAAFRRFKALWDPDGKMNPGKVVDADGVAEHLRLGTDYRPWEPDTLFAFAEDGGSFAHANLRCVGVGECRKTRSGTMCPSYMVTREEKHSTRGRARLLFELLQGDPVSGGWRDEHVHEALDLCLSCKACKSECPVNVDMATYKAEFLHHHWKGRLRPPAAYAMGLIPFWARLATRIPRLANAVVDAPVAGGLVKRGAGIAQRRSAPDFAEESLQAWFRRRSGAGGRPVLLWLDTFTNFFTPEVGQAAVEVLEDAGCHVEIPPRTLCCGRPLYEFGMLPTARRLLREALEVLKPQLRAGTPLVVLEPSCAAAFRDELVELLPNDPAAKRLARQTRTLAEVLRDMDYEPPRIDARVIVQRHCHQQAIIGFGADEAILSATRADVELLDSGCCGMAGSFGYEVHKYDVSVAAAERVLTPAVRRAPADTVVLADGFSCRGQIDALTDRRALHLAQLLQLGLHGQDRTAAGRPEDRAAALVEPPRRDRSRAVAAAGVLAAAAAIAYARRRGVP